MWIYLNNSFLSIVAHNDKPEHMHVRGRRRGDIEAVFPKANVTDTPDRDYAFRADISRSTVEEAMLRQSATSTTATSRDPYPTPADTMNTWRCGA